MISIFIRTYEKDLDWLQYCLRSIQKFVTGYKEIVICIPENQKHLLEAWNLTKEKVVTCPVYGDDYLGQQVSKLNADLYCQGEFILYVDSDCIFKAPFNCEEFLKEGKPVIYKTSYGKVGEALCWQPITERAVNIRYIEFEYMRRLPLMYHSETLKDLRDYMELIHGRTMEQYVIGQPLRQFSEFNALGAFAEKFTHEKYHFINTDEGVEELQFKQYWSWGRITPEIKREIEEVLK